MFVREDFLTIEIRDGIAILWLDHKHESQNIVSPPIIQLLDEAFSEFEKDQGIRAGVIMSRKSNFIAGADIKSFAIEKKGDFRPFQEQGHQALERLEKSNKPVVAAVHGACMGLGTELSLACHAIIASSDPSTRFALPEVQLGLLPGGGGTQRLPRKVGIQRALDMMLTGRNIYAYQAKKMGLADALTDKNKLLQASLLTAQRLLEKKLAPKKSKTFLNRALENTSLGRSVLFSQAKKRAEKKSRGNYPAIPAIIDCVETGYAKGTTAGYQRELELFETLMLTDESAALRSLFFKMTDSKKVVAEERKKIERMAVLGAGLMGGGIAEISVAKGIDVLLKDISIDAVMNARKQIWKGIKKKLKYRSISKLESEQMIERLRGQVDYDHFDHVDLVIEAVVERMDVKKKIIDELEQVTTPDTIIASNTSSLSVTEMADHATHSGRLVGMHYFSPVPKMPLLEIITTPHTEEWVTQSCLEVGIRQGKTCIVVKDSPGFYVNRILGPYMNEALLLLDEGIAIETIDKAFLDLGFPVGPMSLFDEVGLDVAAHTANSLESVVGNRDGFVVHKGVVKMFEAGRLGKKNKKGFYQYAEGKSKKKQPAEAAYAFFKGQGKGRLPMHDIQQRGLLLLINEAVRCLDEQIIQSPVDGDLGAVLGIGFLPFTGGPFSYIDQKGCTAVVEEMERLASAYGTRFTPCDRLATMKESQAAFYPAA